MATKLQALREIESVNFFVSGDQDVMVSSVANINKAAPFQGIVPVAGGPCSLALGTIDNQFNCTTCLGTKRTCPGHNGHVKLLFPLFSPMFFKQIIKVLKKVCHSCGQFLIKKSSNDKKKQKKCALCGYDNPTVSEGNSPLYLEFGFADGKKNYYPYMVRDILDRIQPQALKTLEFDQQAHPSKFIITYLTVPSVIVRADVRYLSGGRSNSDTLTTFIFQTMQANISLPMIIPPPEQITGELYKKYETLALLVYEMIRGTSATASYRNMLLGKTWSSAKIASNTDKSNSLADRIGHKLGRVRGNLLGKRVDQMARGVINGEPRLKISDVKIPLQVAQKIYIPEVFKPYNRETLMTYYLNGPKQYPGARQIKKISDGQIYECDDIKQKGYVPQYGDTIYRQVITGDPVLFNRMPSLYHCSISGHNVVVNVNNPNSLTNQMNIFACNIYNADFDGDEMNLIFGRTPAARVEILEGSTIKRWFINYKNGGTAINITGDSIIVGFELSKETSKFNRSVMLRYFGNTTIIPKVQSDDNDTIYTGKQIISATLPEDINMTTKPKWYNEALSPYIKYTEDERKVVVQNGQLLKGVIDASFAKIYSTIYFKYNATQALTSLFDFQQITLEHALVDGVTISIDNCLPGKDNIKSMMKYTSGLIQDSMLISKDYISGNIIPPIGKTLEQFYEEKQSAALSGDYTDFIYTNVNKYNNGLFKLANTETKGEKGNLQYIIATHGQFLYLGARAPFNFSYRRTSPYHPRCDISPESRGFIPNSFLMGLNGWETFYASQQARRDVLNKSFLISDAGDQGRISVKNLETLIIDNMCFVIKEKKNITQFLYGGNGFDIRYITKVEYPQLLQSDQEFKKRYLYTSSDDKLSQRINEFYNQYYPNYRSIFRNNILYKSYAILEESVRMQIKVPIDCNDILNDIFIRLGKNNFDPSNEDKQTMLDMIQQFINDIPYVYTNERQRELQSSLPDYWKQGVYGIIMNLLMTIDSTIFNKINPQILSECLLKIYMQAKRSVIDYGTPVGIIGAQSLSEPMTQASLNAIHAKGKKQKIKKGGVSRIKEILSAKIKDKSKDPMMTIPLKIGTPYGKAIEIKNRIEKITVGDILSSIEILYERPSAPQSSMFINDNPIIQSYIKINPEPAIMKEGNVFCVRISFDKKLMLTKDINTANIKYVFSKMTQHYYTIHSQMVNDEVFFRFYIYPGENTVDPIKNAKDHMNKIKGITIKGISGIESAAIHTLPKYIENSDGNITEQNVFIITTVGINFEDILLLQKVIPEIQYNKLSCDNIDEMASMFGTGAARNKIITELLNFNELASLDANHLELIADEMVSQGGLGKISRTGANKRIDNALHSIANFGQSKALEQAAITGTKSYIDSISSALMIGDIPRIGTDYNQIAMDVDFIIENKVSVQDVMRSFQEQYE